MLIRYISKFKCIYNLCIERLKWLRKKTSTNIDFYHQCQKCIYKLFQKSNTKLHFYSLFDVSVNCLCIKTFPFMINFAN